MLLGGVTVFAVPAFVPTRRRTKQIKRQIIRDHHTQTQHFLYCGRSVTPRQDLRVNPRPRVTGFSHGGGVGAKAGARGEAAKTNVWLGSMIAIQQYQVHHSSLHRCGHSTYHSCGGGSAGGPRFHSRAQSYGLRATVRAQSYRVPGMIQAQRCTSTRWLDASWLRDIHSDSPVHHYIRKCKDFFHINIHIQTVLIFAYKVQYLSFTSNTYTSCA